MTPERPVEQLVGLLEHARRVPLLRERVRVDKVEVLRLADAIAAQTSSRAGHDSRARDLLAVVGSVSDAVRRAYPIPLTDQVRLPAAQVGRLAAELRASVAS